MKKKIKPKYYITMLLYIRRQIYYNSSTNGISRLVRKVLHEFQCNVSSMK